MFASKMENFNDKFTQLLFENNKNDNLTKLMILVRFPGIKFNLDTRIKYSIDVIYYYYNLNDISDFQTDQLNKLVMFINKKIKDESVSYLSIREWQDAKDYIEKCEYDIEIKNINNSYYNECFDYYCDNQINNYENEENEESFY